MSDVKVNVKVTDNGDTAKLEKQVLKLQKAFSKAIDEAARIPVVVAKAREEVAVSNIIKNTGAVPIGTRGNIPSSKPGSASDTNLSRGLGGQTKAEGRDFAKQAQGLGGLVHVYATFAANIFAVSAAFSALSKAADTTNMVKGLDQLGAVSGRALGSLAKQLASTTDGAISLRDAMTATAQASAGGMTNAAILRMGNVAKQASQALGIAMPDAISRLSRGITKLEPELLDEIGIMVRVDTASQNYARSIGKSASALTDFEKRQGFANAVLEQGEKKFGAIQIDANPYAKILASMENIAQTGLNLVNTVLSPIVTLLASNPTALATAMSGIAVVLLKQAIPAVGMFKENLKLATENAERMANIKSLEAKKAKIEGIAAAKQLAEAKAEIEVANVDAAVNRIRQIREKDFSKASATNKILQKAAQDVTEKDFKVLEANAKSKETAGKPELAKSYRDASIAIKESQAAEAAYEAAVIKGTKALSENVSIRKTAGQVQAIADRANLDASARAIKSQAAETASIHGFSAAWKEAGISIAKARSGPSTKNIEITSIDALGKSVTTLEQVVTPKMGAMQAGWTRLGVGIGAATGAIGTFMNFLGPWVFGVGLLIGAFELLSSWLSSNTKESEKFTSSITSAEDSIANMSRTLDAITTKDPLEVFSVQTVQARANALQGLSDTLGSLVSDFDKLQQASSSWDNAIDALWDAIGKGAADKLSSSIANSIVTGLSGLEKGPLKAEAVEKLQKILGKDIDVSNFKAVNAELRKLSNPEVTAAGLGINKILKDASREANNAAANLTGVLASLGELAKLVQTQRTALMPSDAVGKLGASMLSSAGELSKALQEPINSLLVLKDIVGDTNKLSLLSPETGSELLANKNKIESLSKSYGDLQKQVLEGEARLQKLRESGKDIKEGARWSTKKVDSEEAKETKIAIASLTVAAEAAKRDLKIFTSEISTKVAADFVNIGLKNLASSLTAAVAEGGITAARGYLSVLKDAGMQTAEAEGKLKAQELGLQKQVLDATYAQVRQQQQNTNTLEINNILISKLANEMALTNSGTSESRRAAALEEQPKLEARLAEAIQKANLTNLSPQQAAKVRGGGEFSDKVLSEMSGYLATMVGYQSGIAKLEGQASANKIATFAADKKEETAAAQKAKLQKVSGLDTGIADITSLIAASSQYDSILHKKKDTLETDKRALLYANQELETNNKLDILQEAGKRTDIDKTKLKKAIASVEAEGFENAKKFEQENRLAALKSLDERLKGEDAIRVKQASISAQILSDTQAITNAKLQQQESDVQYLTTIGALTAEDSTRKLANIALQQQALQYEKDSAALKAETDTKAAALSDKLAVQSATGVDTSKTFADLTLLEVSYNKQKTALDLINQAKVTSITLTSELKALQESQALQMEKMASATQSLTSLFGDLGTSIGKAGESILKLSQYDQTYLKNKEELKRDIAKAEKENNPEEAIKLTKAQGILNKKASKDQLDNIADVVGATKDMFAEHTFAAKALGALEKGIHIVKMAQFVQAMFMDTTATGVSVANSGVRAAADGVAAVVKTLASLPFPLNIAAGGAVAALVAGLLSSIGASSSSGSISMSGMTSADRQETQGTGQTWSNGAKVDTGGGIFGNSEAKSTSIVDSLAIMRENSIEGLNYDNKMLKALEKLANSVEGAAKSLYSVPGLRQGTSFGTQAGSISTEANTGLLGTLMSFSSGVPLLGNAISGLLGNALGGGSSSSSSITSAGIKFKGSFQDVINDVSGSIVQYKDVLTSFHEDGGWFKSDKDWSEFRTETATLKSDVAKSLGDVFRDANSLFQELGTKAGISLNTISSTLSSFDVSMPVDIMNLKGQELIDELDAVIGSKIAEASKRIFTGFDKYKNFGEDYLATVIRVVDASSKVDAALKSIGNSFSVVSKFDISEAMVKNAGSLSTFMEQADFFKNNFLTSAEQLAPVQKSVNAELSKLGLSTSITRDQFKELVLAQNLSTTQGQELFQSLMELAPGFDSVTKSVKDSTSKLTSLTIELLTAEGKASQAVRLTREEELKTLTASEALLKQRIYLLNDEASKMALEQKIYTALGNVSAALTITRQTELRTITDILKPAQEYLYALEDMATLKGKLTTAYNSEAAAIKGTITSLTTSIKTLKEYQTALVTGASSILTPTEKYIESKASVLETAAAASTTGMSDLEVAARSEALNKLPAVTSSFLAASKDLYASSSQYTTDFNSVLDILSSTTDTLTNQKTAAEQQLAALDSSVSFLDLISTNTDTTATLLGKYLAAQQVVYSTQQVAAQAGSGAAASTLLNIPAFASGGIASGTVLVGERGPELVNFTNPGRVYSNKASNDMLNNKELIAEIRSLRNDLNQLRQEQKEQTGHIIATNYDANNRNADEIAQVTKESVKQANWATRSAVRIA